MLFFNRFGHGGCVNEIHDMAYDHGDDKQQEINSKTSIPSCVVSAISAPFELSRK
jgi:hypothetical protein